MVIRVFILCSLLLIVSTKSVSSDMNGRLTVINVYSGLKRIYNQNQDQNESQLEPLATTKPHPKPKPHPLSQNQHRTNSIAKQIDEPVEDYPPVDNDVPVDKDGDIPIDVDLWDMKVDYQPEEVTRHPHENHYRSQTLLETDWKLSPEYDSEEQRNTISTERTYVPQENTKKKQPGFFYTPNSRVGIHRKTDPKITIHKEIKKRPGSIIYNPNSLWNPNRKFTPQQNTLEQEQDGEVELETEVSKESKESKEEEKESDNLFNEPYAYEMNLTEIEVPNEQLLLKQSKDMLEKQEEYSYYFGEYIPRKPSIPKHNHYGYGRRPNQYNFDRNDERDYRQQPRKRKVLYPLKLKPRIRNNRMYYT